jgi:hypothetical protein
MKWRKLVYEIFSKPSPVVRRGTNSKIFISLREYRDDQFGLFPYCQMAQNLVSVKRFDLMVNSARPFDFFTLEQ